MSMAIQNQPFTVKCTLKTPITITGKSHTEIVVREGSLADILAAERGGASTTYHERVVGQLCQQIISIGTYNGPVTEKILGKLKRADYFALINAMNEADAGGEPE